MRRKDEPRDPLRVAIPDFPKYFVGRNGMILVNHHGKTEIVAITYLDHKQDYFVVMEDFRGKVRLCRYGNAVMAALGAQETIRRLSRPILDSHCPEAVKALRSAEKRSFAVLAKYDSEEL